MKKVFIILSLLVLSIGFVLSAPTLIAWLAHKSNTSSSLVVDASAQAFHDSLFISDLHADTLLWQRDLLKQESYGHVDVPRLQKGNVSLQLFTVVTHVPRTIGPDNTDGDTLDLITVLSIASQWPKKTWTDRLERALHQSEKLHDAEKRSKGRLRIIRSKRDLRKFIEAKANKENVTAGILGLEGLHVGEIEAVDKLFEAGFRMLAPTHFFDTFMGGSAHGLKKNGLTPFGHEVLKKMQALNMALDLSHASPAILDEVLTLYPQIPVVISHTGVKGTCPGSRNLSDEHLRAIASSGGLVGIGYFNMAICGDDVEAIVKAIKYSVDLIGADHVALGSDFDGMVRTPFDTSGLVQVTQGLINEGMNQVDIAKVMGENTKAYFLKVLPE